MVKVTIPVTNNYSECIDKRKEKFLKLITKISYITPEELDVINWIILTMDKLKKAEGA